MSLEMADHRDDPGPVTLTLEPGRHAFCLCGRSARGKLCDGSHRGTQIRPHKLDVEAPTVVRLCGCGHSGNLPYCDGSHSR
jgi:CDGSH-type Zn-finger protein